MRTFGYSLFELMYGQQYDPKDLGPVVDEWFKLRDQDGGGYADTWEDLPREEERKQGAYWIETANEMSDISRGRLLEEQDKLINREREKRWKDQPWGPSFAKASCVG